MVKDPQTPTETRPLGGPNTDPHKAFGLGYWSHLESMKTETKLFSKGVFGRLDDPWKRFATIDYVFNHYIYHICMDRYIPVTYTFIWCTYSPTEKNLDKVDHPNISDYALGTYVEPSFLGQKETMFLGKIEPPLFMFFGVQGCITYIYIYSNGTNIAKTTLC